MNNEDVQENIPILPVDNETDNPISEESSEVEILSDEIFIPESSPPSSITLDETQFQAIIEHQNYLKSEIKNIEDGGRLISYIALSLLLVLIFFTRRGKT